jgi:uncharacterized protein
MSHYVLSKYNCFKEYDNVVIGINLYVKLLFAIEIKKYKMLLLYKENLNELKEIDPSFFSLMYKLGTIQDSEIDNNIKNILLLENRKICFNSTSYNLTINPTLNCNFNCWYCYEDHSKKKMNNSTINAIKKHINIVLSKNRFSEFILMWFGGEPLLCFKNIIQPIALYAKKLCEKYNIHLESGITTNGYYINEEMINIFREINMQSFLITLDSNENVHNKTRFQKNKINTYRKITDNIILLAEKLNPNDLNLRINFTKESFYSITDIIDSFYPQIRKKIKISLIQVIQDQVKNKISLEEIETARLKFEEAGFLIDRKMLKTKGYKCQADLYNQAIINYDGRIFKCPAQNFEKEKEDGILTKEGNIIWNDSLLSCKICKASFDNDICMNCMYLPICFGICNKKIPDIREVEDFDKYCSYNYIKDILFHMMNEFKKTGKGLSYLLNYR